MLKNIPTCMSPDLLRALCAIGHGSKIMICDGNCDIKTLGHPDAFRIRVDGVGGAEILKAILDLIPLDDYIDNSVRICKTDNGIPAPGVWKKYEEIVRNSEEYAKLPNGIDYQDGKEFWSVAPELDLVIGTGEEDIYGNIFVQKGVIRKK
ncbi:MAG: fucose isomerase [Clostridiales bacterium]|uniref:L-fucose mutarotase n=1 Tax=Harryflintia acetispora TaxID=1849041 RepID=A0A9X8UKN8_9FIRM|nr:MULTISPECIES: RbsD/FucU domain-containing protein [Oscillospiraceae]PWM40367.1 MAG: fucose isomerase [Clostridiales bacterium]RGB69700.1 fucose isomerase [Harryflintia acetispora]TCL44527.1 L-fucose mutarotase [Harryflintia acetispora]